jgi:RNA polymerase primary sigma factor
VAAVDLDVEERRGDPVGGEVGGGAATYGDLLEDESAPRPIDTIVASELEATARAALGVLTAREADIVRRRFGLGTGGAEETLEEIGRRHGVTRERIRQIEAKALDKLRHPAAAQALCDFLEP